MQTNPSTQEVADVANRQASIIYLPWLTGDASMPSFPPYDPSDVYDSLWPMNTPSRKGVLEGDVDDATRAVVTVAVSGRSTNAWLAWDAKNPSRATEDPTPYSAPNSVDPNPIPTVPIPKVTPGQSVPSTPTTPASPTSPWLYVGIGLAVVAVGIGTAIALARTKDDAE